MLWHNLWPTRSVWRKWVTAWGLLLPVVVLCSGNGLFDLWPASHATAITDAGQDMTWRWTENPPEKGSKSLTQTGSVLLEIFHSGHDYNGWLVLFVHVLIRIFTMQEQFCLGSMATGLMKVLSIAKKMTRNAHVLIRYQTNKFWKKPRCFPYFVVSAPLFAHRLPYSAAWIISCCNVGGGGGGGGGGYHVCWCTGTSDVLLFHS